MWDALGEVEAKDDKRTKKDEQAWLSFANAAWTKGEGVLAGVFRADALLRSGNAEAAEKVAKDLLAQKATDPLLRQSLVCLEGQALSAEYSAAAGSVKSGLSSEIKKLYAGAIAPVDKDSRVSQDPSRPISADLWVNGALLYMTKGFANPTLAKRLAGEALYADPTNVHALLVLRWQGEDKSDDFKKGFSSLAGSVFEAGGGLGRTTIGADGSISNTDLFLNMKLNLPGSNGGPGGVLALFLRGKNLNEHSVFGRIAGTQGYPQLLPVVPVEQSAQGGEKK
jgi:hypothetical protein